MQLDMWRWYCHWSSMWWW